MKGVIWDCDGTLLDTEPLYLEAEGAVVKQFNPANDIRTILPQLLGTVPMDSAKVTIAAFDLPMTPEQYVADRQQRMEILLKKGVPFLPAIPELVAEFAARGLVQSVATSSGRSLYIQKRQSHVSFFDKYFPVQVCGDEVLHGKPAPDIFLRAAEKMECHPSECIVFEDAPGGVEGAKVAGMMAIAIRNEHVDAELYRKAGADQVVDSWTQVDVSSLLQVPVVM